jgi:phospholipase/carboxylesterase
MHELDGVEREIGERIDLAVIWLHGLGADANDFLPIIGELDLATGVRFVFPNAPTRRVTINGGMFMRAWYDITGFGPDAPADKVGLTASVALVRQLILREIDRGIAPERVVLAGFSQGGAVVLHAGLGDGTPVGGILGLSTYLPAPELLTAGGRMAIDVPVMMAHGTMDPVIPLALAERSLQVLLANGVNVDWSTYPMGHEVSPAEISDISDWLRRFASH